MQPIRRLRLHQLRRMVQINFKHKRESERHAHAIAMQEPHFDRQIRGKGLVCECVRACVYAGASVVSKCDCNHESLCARVPVCVYICVRL